MGFIGENLKKFRQEKKMSRDDLAKKIRKNGKIITSRTILNWENGTRRPDADSLLKLSKIFDKALILFFIPVTYKKKDGE